MWISRSDWNGEVEFRKIVQARSVEQFYANLKLESQNEALMGAVARAMSLHRETTLFECRECGPDSVYHCDTRKALEGTNG